MFKSIAVAFKSSSLPQVWHAAIWKRKNWARRNELKQMVKINILFNIGNLTINYVEKYMSEYF